MKSFVEIDPGWKWDDNFAMCQGMRIGRFVYVSGQIALDPSGALVGVASMTEQSSRVFHNIETVLQLAGGTLADVVKITAFLTDMSRYPEYNAVRTKVFRGHRPASSTVEVAKLAFEGLLVEVEAIAYVE
jgi:2-iminobutanoate/2-iminopropanoate deaminase